MLVRLRRGAFYRIFRLVNIILRVCVTSARLSSLSSFSARFRVQKSDLLASDASIIIIQMHNNPRTVRLSVQVRQKSHERRGFSRWENGAV